MTGRPAQLPRRGRETDEFDYNERGGDFQRGINEAGSEKVRIGENTQGVFCDVLDRHLPNGWTFGLPNAVYRSASGSAFDVTGIPPDIEVPLFSESDLAAGKDPGLAKAVQLLTASLSVNN